MSNTYANHAASIAAHAKSTPQTEPIPGREAEMVKNNAGGFTFSLDDFAVLDRFLMIGSESEGYYVGAKETTNIAFALIKKCAQENGVRMVDRIVEYSLAGRAPKNDPSIVALAHAAVFGNEETVKAAYEALPKVCRIGTHLFLFVSILNSLGKWNAAAKRGVAKWYTNRSDDKLTVQLLKYQQRNGWAHRDVLRLAHVKPVSEIQSNLFGYAVKGELPEGAVVTQTLIDFESMKRNPNKKDVLKIIEGGDLLTWEMVPNVLLTDKDILMALLQNMGMTAMIRKLGALSAHGVIAPMSEGVKLVVSKLANVESIKKSRIHPLTILQAMRQYSAGAGEKGSLTWNVNQQVVNALDDAFYMAFSPGENTDENYFMGLDISGSMWGAKVNGSSNLVAAEVATVMAMAAARNQKNYFIAGFNTSLVNINIDPKMRLDAALSAVLKTKWDGAGTNCAAPAEYAARHKIPVDKIIIITDNETYSGSSHPSQALKLLRSKIGRPVKQIVIGTSVSDFTIADPTDPLQLDIAGFDSAAPQIISNF